MNEHLADKLDLVFLDSIADIGASSWNALSGYDNPFTRHEFLLALEESGCTITATGWQPHHLLAYYQSTESRSEEKRKLVAIMPLYRKTNSYGEYVFDWAWANAYTQHGYRYYPKLLTAIPFTPSVGSRLFVSDDVNEAEVFAEINQKIRSHCRDIKASSWHILFPDNEQFELFNKEADLLGRSACQFHWYNKNFKTYDDFLQTLNSRKRKSIKRERRSVFEQGIKFTVLEGHQISLRQWTQFFRFYQNTYRIRGMEAYLNLDFFVALAKALPDKIMLVLAYNDSQNTEAIAGALFFKSSKTLYGRYWGCLDEYQFLHFETCFYQGQEYCISHQLQSFDSGAQGEHKIQRGFEPFETHSNHWIAHEGFRHAIADFLVDEKKHIDQYRQQASDYLPFKKPGPEK